MDQEVLVYVVIVAVALVLGICLWLRERHLLKKSVFRDKHSVGLVTGSDVARRILAEAGIDGVTIKPKDATIQRSYFCPRRQCIVLTTESYYGCGMYGVMVAANCAENAVQRVEAYRWIDIYLWLLPVMEWMSRMLPLFIFAGLFCVSFNPILVGSLTLMLWLLLLVGALLMRPIAQDASRRSVDWLLGQGLFIEEDREMLQRAGRYLSNYNLWLVATAGLALIGSRRRFLSSEQI